MKSAGFKESGADPCFFIKTREKDKKIIAVYVDDLVLMAKTLDETQQMKEGLSNTFKMKDMEQLRYCLGINCELTEQGISLCQKQYLLKLLEKYRLSEANTVSTPMDLNVKLVIMILTARKLMLLNISLWLAVYYMQLELHAQI